MWMLFTVHARGRKKKTNTENRSGRRTPKLNISIIINNFLEVFVSFGSLSACDFTYKSITKYKYVRDTCNLTIHHHAQCIYLPLYLTMYNWHGERVVSLNSYTFLKHEIRSDFSSQLMTGSKDRELFVIDLYLFKDFYYSVLFRCTWFVDFEPLTRQYNCVHLSTYPLV